MFIVAQCFVQGVFQPNKLVTPRVNGLCLGKCRRLEWNFREVIFKLISMIDGWGALVKFALQWMSLDLTCLLMISRHWFRWWFGASRQQAIARANIHQVLCRHIMPLSHNKLIKRLFSSDDTIENDRRDIWHHCTEVNMIDTWEHSSYTPSIVGYIMASPPLSGKVKEFFPEWELSSY